MIFLFCRLTPSSCWRTGFVKSWWCRWPSLCTKDSCSTPSPRSAKYHRDSHSNLARSKDEKSKTIYTNKIRKWMRHLLLYDWYQILAGSEHCLQSFSYGYGLSDATEQPSFLHQRSWGVHLKTKFIKKKGICQIALLILSWMWNSCCARWTSSFCWKLHTLLLCSFV